MGVQATSDADINAGAAAFESEEATSSKETNGRRKKQQSLRASSADHAEMEVFEQEVEDYVDTSITVNFRRRMYLLLDESDSGPCAWTISMVILALITASSFSFVMESHPYVMCKYAKGKAAECTNYGDSTSRVACEAGNNTFAPPVAAVGMYEDCHAALTLEACEGNAQWYEMEAAQSVGAACQWQMRGSAGKCEFVGLQTEECTQWISPFELFEPSDGFTTGEPNYARELRRTFRMSVRAVHHCHA
jgi:hypothetical protein